MGSFSRFVFFVGLGGIIFMSFFGEVRTIKGFKISLATELPSFNEVAMNEALNQKLDAIAKQIEKLEQLSNNNNNNNNHAQQQSLSLQSTTSAKGDTTSSTSTATATAAAATTTDTTTEDTTAEKLRQLKASASALAQKRIHITEPEQPPAHLKGRRRKAWLRRQREQQEKSPEAPAAVAEAAKEEEKEEEKEKEEEEKPAASTSKGAIAEPDTIEEEKEKEEEEKDPTVAKRKKTEPEEAETDEAEPVTKEEEEKEEKEEEPKESITPKAAAKTTAAAATTKHIPATELPPSSNQYNHKLQVADYLAAPPARPTEDWLTHCAADMFNDKTLVKAFPTQRPQYALGDCILKCNKCDYGYLVPDPKKRSRFIPVGNPTMAHHYGKKACPNKNGKSDDNKRRDLDLTSEIIREFETYSWFQNGTSAPHPDAIVLHFRLGDVIELQGGDAGYLLTQGGIGKHPKAQKRRIKTIRSFYEYLDTIDEHYQQQRMAAAAGGNTLPEKKVVIVGGSHKPHLFTNSRIYANCIQRGLAMAGYDTEMILDTPDADVDFYYMTNAKIFMTSTGGFSALIADMVKKNGGQVIGRDLN